MRIWRTRAEGGSIPLTPSSVRVLIAGSVGVLIWVIWVTGMLGDSRHVTMLALSAVSILGLALVLELRHRYLIEEEARENARRHRFLTEHSFDMVVRYNPRTRKRTYVSPASQRLYGYTPEEMVGRSVEEIVHPEDLELVRAALETVQQDGEHPPFVYRARCKDGTYTWVEASLTLLRDPGSGEFEIMSIVRDAGERVRYEAALRQAKEAADAANRSKSHFLATMSHELRTPLNAIIGFADIMHQEVMGPLGNEQYRAYVSDIQLSGSHLLQLINDILDLTKAEAGKLELNDETIDPAEVVGAVARLSRGAIEKAAISVEIDIPADMPPLRADERKARQVLFNLIGNAIKFTPPGGRIRISGDYAAKTGMRIIVADSGIGIAPEDLQRVLEPFIQVDSELSRNHPGTGLGLPAVKAIMELHGGTLELRSTLGAGTEAIVSFPPERAVISGKETGARSAA